MKAVTKSLQQMNLALSCHLIDTLIPYFKASERCLREHEKSMIFQFWFCPVFSSFFYKHSVVLRSEIGYMPPPQIFLIWLSWH